MAKEIERKFLVADRSWRENARDAAKLRQAYIASGPDRSVRVRITAKGKARLTIKIGGSGLVRDEFEYDIPVDEAEEMMALAVGNVIEKTRHKVKFGGFVWEIDVFEGAYKGLVMAEVEMSSTKDDPELPAWLGREVTGDARYSNHYLAVESGPAELLHALSL
ncbi:CYTH domain-containing protein [Rhizobium halophytocola]|uniref:CYTH domain-containing protein n=1 Tax=Rhizobium halophytocola TaxID=735519 RepID=A0ABS4DTI1_9HYPH|nr:CYTH domain-containing protein [Rhizobium halophytocola]